MAPTDFVSPPSLHQQVSAQTKGAKDAARTPGRGWRTYTVRAGDTLSHIAVRHDTSVAALVRANTITSRVLHVGTQLRVPTPAPARSVAAAPRGQKTPARAAATARRHHAKAAAPARLVRTHRVQPGDNLITLGIRYATGWRALAKANRIANPHRIAVGTVLRVPVPPGPEKQPTAGRPAAKPATTTRATPRQGTPTLTHRTGGGTTGRPTQRNTFAGRTYPDHVVASAAANRAALRQIAVPSRTQTRDLISTTARRYGVNPRLALAIGWQESGWNQRAVSVANAVGIMQVMPTTGTWCAGLVGRKLNLMDPEDNVVAGVALLRWLSANAKNQDQAIAGYYQGLGGVRKNGMYPDTKVYVRSVKSHMARF